MGEPPRPWGGPELLTWAASLSTMFLPGEAAGGLKARQGEAVQPASQAPTNHAAALPRVCPGPPLCPHSVHQSRGSTGKPRRRRKTEGAGEALPCPSRTQVSSPRPSEQVGRGKLGPGLREDMVRPDILTLGTDPRRSSPDSSHKQKQNFTDAARCGRSACLLDSPAHPGNLRTRLEPARFLALGLAKPCTNSKLSASPPCAYSSLSDGTPWPHASLLSFLLILRLLWEGLEKE